MAVSKQKKAEILKGLEEKFGKAKAIYFAEYRSIPVKDITALRKKMTDAGIDYVVAKKTLMRLAAKKHNLPEISNEFLTGPVAAVIGYDDVVAPSKFLAEFGKTNENLKIIGGILEGKLLSKADAVAMSKLPSKEELLAQLVRALNGPISGFHGVGHGLLSKFVRTVDAVREKQSQ